MSDSTYQPKPEPFKLTLRLVGRVCLVKHGGKYTALFLNARHNRELGLRKHRPLLCGPLGDVVPGIVQDTDRTFADSRSVASGLWKVKGFDMRFSGLIYKKSPKGDSSLGFLANLKKIYEPIVKNAKWCGVKELIDADPRARGVAARLSLEGFETIRATDPQGSGIRDRTFVPGKHEQRVMAMIECVGHFKPHETGPTLECKTFNGRERRRYEFRNENNLELSVSNLCRCGGDSPSELRRKAENSISELVPDDEEFTLYYELLNTPPPLDKRPIPHYMKDDAGGGRVPECYDPSFLDASS